jgi:hypothetical protein
LEIAGRAIARARGDHNRARLHRLPVVDLDAQRLAAVGAAAVEPHRPERDGDLGAELLRLVEGAAGKRLAGDAGREAEIILDARRSAGLAAEGALVEHDHRQAFRGGVNGGGKTGGPGADHRDVIDGARVEFGRDTQAHSGRGIGRPLQHLAVGTDHQRQFVGVDAETLDRSARLLVGDRVEHGEGITVAREKTFQPQQVGRAGTADQQRADAAVLDQRDAPQDESAHDDLADLGRADHQRADMRGVERQRQAAMLAGARARQGAAARELADLAGKLARAEHDHRAFLVQPVASADLHDAAQHQPGRHVAHTDIVDELARREFPRRGAGEALRRRDLNGIEDRKDLVEAGVDETHGISGRRQEVRAARLVGLGGFSKPVKRR